MHTLKATMQPHKLYTEDKSDRYLCLLVLSEGLFFCIWLYGYQCGVWGVEAIERLGIPKKKKKKKWDKWEGKREVFWPLVAFTTRAQIIEGHGNWSDRWTMLPFSNPLWTGPSITGGEINSIHQLFVSLGPLMPPDIAQGGLINVCGFDLSPLAWHWIKTLLFYS